MTYGTDPSNMQQPAPAYNAAPTYNNAAPAYNAAPTYNTAAPAYNGAPAQPAPAQPAGAQQAPVIGTGQYFLWILLFSFPIVGLICAIVLAASSTMNPNLKNWAKAQLIWMVLGFVFLLLFRSAISSAMSSVFDFIVMAVPFLF
ncbi:MAG: hypothetical protein PUF97_02755 [Bifidobacteriaceae bacterium]|nr:hypothetical protein [Bifidobacteriaceae bacterium]